jgi:hypothetical protein
VDQPCLKGEPVFAQMPAFLDGNENANEIGMDTGINLRASSAVMFCG